MSSIDKSYSLITALDKKIETWKSVKIYDPEVKAELDIAKTLRALKSAVEALEKASSIIIEDNCSECGFFNGVRYEITPAKEALAKIETQMKGEEK